MLCCAGPGFQIDGLTIRCTPTSGRAGMAPKLSIRCMPTSGRAGMVPIRCTPTLGRAGMVFVLVKRRLRHRRRPHHGVEHPHPVQRQLRIHDLLTNHTVVPRVRRPRTTHRTNQWQIPEDDAVRRIGRTRLLAHLAER